MDVKKAEEAVSAPKPAAVGYEEEVEKNLEAELARIGTGRFPIVMYVLIGVCKSLIAMQFMVASFINAEPPHHCRVLAAAHNATTNVTAALLQWIPEVDVPGGERMLAQCLMYTSPGGRNATTQPCQHGWTFYNEQYGITTVTEWSLVCDSSEKLARTTTVFMAGVLVGCLLLTAVADMYGRKLMIIVYNFLVVPFGVGAAFADSWLTMTVLKFCTALFSAGSLTIGYVLACEYFPSQQRSIAGNMFQMFWTLGYITLPLLAYYITNWRYLQTAITLAIIPLTVTYFWFVPESLHFLISKDRLQEAELILQKGADLNGKYLKVSLGPGLDKEWEQSKSTATEPKAREVQAVEECSSLKQADKRYNLYHVITARYFNVMAFLLCFIWLVNALVYYGLSLGTNQLAGNRFLNFFLSGIVEIPAYAAAALLIKYVGRRKPSCAFHLIAGLSLFVKMFIPLKTESGADLSWLQTTLTMVGKFGITASWSSIFLITAELYPTVLRNSGLGMSSSCARIGSMLAPYTIYFAKTSPLIQPITFGVLAVLAGSLVLLFPETMHHPLPETLAEVTEPWLLCRRPVCSRSGGSSSLPCCARNEDYRKGGGDGGSVYSHQQQGSGYEMRSTGCSGNDS